MQQQQQQQGECDETTKKMEPQKKREDPASKAAAAAVGNEPSSNNTRNAFAHMMQQSKKMNQSTAQQFHLNADYTLSWSDLTVGGFTPNNNNETVTCWSTTIQLRNKDDDKKIQLTLSSSIPEQQPSSSPPVARRRLVQRHSRLSVPVLKSILQKLIRRRRPLPATRVAMELMDKALGEVLRRMPIIILEDSTLHPDFPLLCWLMAAESKNYKIPLELLSRVLQIVYDVSSCPWTDYHYLDTDDDNTEDDFSVVDDDDVRPEARMMLKCMDMRASYGGMKCDMKMLQRYRTIWGKRFRTTTTTTTTGTIIPPDVSKRLGGESAPTIKWMDVPDFIHCKTRYQGIQHITSMMKEPLIRLQLQDLCVEGVDFHCSDVLDQLLKDDAFVSTSFDRLIGEKVLETTGCSSKDQLMVILKRCMWKYSSGVNFRQPLLLGNNASTKDDDDSLKSFWQDLVAKRVKDFMTRYVTSRLATSSSSVVTRR